MAPKESFVDSVVDVLLRQQGRDLFEDGCNEEKCFDNTGMDRANKVPEERPDCCFAGKVIRPINRVLKY